MIHGHVLCIYFVHVITMNIKAYCTDWFFHRSSITGDDLNVMHGRWLKGWLTIVNYACAMGWLNDKI